MSADFIEGPYKITVKPTENEKENIDHLRQLPFSFPLPS